MIAEADTRFIRASLNGELYDNPETLDMQMETIPAVALGFTGYGLGLGELQPGIWDHAGNTLGFGSMVLYAPELDTSFILLTNSSSNTEGLAPLLLESFLFPENAGS